MSSSELESTRQGVAGGRRAGRARRRAGQAAGRGPGEAGRGGAARPTEAKELSETAERGRGAAGGANAPRWTNSARSWPSSATRPRWPTGSSPRSRWPAGTASVTRSRRGKSNPVRLAKGLKGAAKPVKRPIAPKRKPVAGGQAKDERPRRRLPGHHLDQDARRRLVQAQAVPRPDRPQHPPAPHGGGDRRAARRGAAALRVAADHRLHPARLRQGAAAGGAPPARWSSR